MDSPNTMSSEQIIKNLFNLLPKQVIEDTMFHYRKDYEAFGYDLQTSIDKFIVKSQSVNRTTRDENKV